MGSAPTRLLRWFALRIVRRTVARGVDGLSVTGVERARAALAGGPVVFAMNHVCWWDALVWVLVVADVGGAHRVLVSPDGLSRFPFFRLFGALPTDLGGLRAARAHLSGPHHAVWVFPQGRYRPAHERPLGLASGAERLAERVGAALIPVGVAYPFAEAPVPEARVAFGDPVAATVAQLESGVVAQIDGLVAMRGRLLSPRRPPESTWGSSALSLWFRLAGGADG